MWDSARTGVDALPACHTLVGFDKHCPRFPADRQRLRRADLDAWIVLALGAEMRELGAGDQHEHPYSGGFGPYTFLVEK
jgi:hypothetical protein